MWDWLLTPVDPSRAHDVGFAVSWHARTMVLGWGILAPLTVLIARFLKIMPGQDWPRELDSPVWWRSHWIGQSVVSLLSLAALVLVLPAEFSQMSLHRWLGYAVLAGMVAQVVLGICRGSKGGPTSPARDGSPRGHHYDMTPWRRSFEMLHKTLGYSVLFLAAITILAGLWDTNAARWMWLSLSLWWIFLISLFCILQKRGMAVDTYQAIWGDDPSHPGNQGPAPKWGMRRLATRQGGGDVRRD